ncbi:hypothetical protein GQ55_7G112400 [Panicum hallii var. hallii]|uniref:Uncharacterized protein n=1 Tax=Panicum hallii var. hallii TaxID=1504633 RepID=A0A2T7CTZ9_9POAL|nr:hypothetical protein GQ55_7G112400 [Panicum hallii var. hallii]
MSPSRPNATFQSPSRPRRPAIHGPGAHLVFLRLSSARALAPTRPERRRRPADGLAGGHLEERRPARPSERCGRAPRRPDVEAGITGRQTPDGQRQADATSATITGRRTPDGATGRDSKPASKQADLIVHLFPIGQSSNAHSFSMLKLSKLTKGNVAGVLIL